MFDCHIMFLLENIFSSSRVWLGLSANGSKASESIKRVEINSPSPALVLEIKAEARAMILKESFLEIGENVSL